MSIPEAAGNSLARPIDAMSAVRQHPEWYFRSGQFAVGEAIALLTDEALAHGSHDLLVRELQGWWLLASLHDWLDGDMAAFFSPVPDPTRGQNMSRVEVVLTAFCHTVWTASSGASMPVAGGAEPPEEARAMLESATWQRVIAFLPPAVSQQSGSTHEGQRHLQLVTDDLSSRYDEAMAALPEKLDQVHRAGVNP